MNNVVAAVAKLGFQNAATIVQAAKDAELELAIALAIVRQESRGAHVYGHDSGGVYSTNGTAITVDKAAYPAGSNIPVTASNYAGFYSNVVTLGARSNGVGICQITYAGAALLTGEREGGFLRRAKEAGFDLSDPLDNCRYSFGSIIRPALKGSRADSAILEMATRYNSGSWKGAPTPYAGRVLESVRMYRDVLPAPDSLAEIVGNHVLAAIEAAMYHPEN